jgi:hypothetical protein
MPAHKVQAENKRIKLKIILIFILRFIRYKDNFFTAAQLKSIAIILLNGRHQGLSIFTLEGAF